MFGAAAYASVVEPHFILVQLFTAFIYIKRPEMALQTVTRAVNVKITDHRINQPNVRFIMYRYLNIKI